MLENQRVPLENPEYCSVESTHSSMSVDGDRNSSGTTVSNPQNHVTSSDTLEHLLSQSS